MSSIKSNIGQGTLFNRGEFLTLKNDLFNNTIRQTLGVYTMVQRLMFNSLSILGSHDLSSPALSQRLVAGLSVGT